MRAFYAYRIFCRHREFGSLFYATRLFQQFLVDAWATVDQEKLNWAYHNQDKLRVDLYTGLEDVLAYTDADDAVHRTG